MSEKIDESIRKAAEVLKEAGAKEVYVFGSAATGKMDEYSDVDMAVTGLPAEVFFRSWARAVKAFPGREMDLVNLDHNNPFARFLMEEGELKRVG